MKKIIIATFLFLSYFPNNAIASWDGYGDNPLPSKIEGTGSVTAGNEALGIEVMTDDTAVMQCGLGALLAAFGFDTKAKYSRINSLDIDGTRAVWVDDFSYSSQDGSPTIRACASQCMLLVIENCVKITTKQGSVTRAFPLKPDSKIKAEKRIFTTSEIGDTADGDGETTQGHRVGYVFNLYSGNCPYYNTTNTDICMSQARNGGTIAKEYIKNVPYSESNNCYEAVKSMYTSCLSEPGDCQCIHVSDDDPAKANCDASTDFIPDESGQTWKSYAPKKRACFSCYQEARKMLNKCIRASFDLGVGYGPKGNFSKAVAKMIGNMRNSIAQTDYNNLKTFRKMYGAGTYVCAYEDNEDSRIGCMKIEAIKTPNPFPRIAFKAPLSASEIAKYNSDPVKASKDMFFVYSASQIFDKAPYVSEFKDEDISGSCYGKADLGEEYRGDFFNPAIYVQYGSNRQRLWFLNSDPGTSMVKKYQTTSIKCPNCGYNDENEVITKYSELPADKILEYKQMASEWSTEYPVIIYYGKATSVSQACEVTLETETFKRICTRLEYDQDLDEEYFKAYIVSNENAPAATCNSLYENDNMKVLGGVIRPPLKYNYDQVVNKTISPIVISAPIATDTSSQSTVYIKPEIVEYFVIPNGSNGISKISFTNQSGSTPQAIAIAAKNLQLQFFNLKLTIPTGEADATAITSLASIIENNNQCGFILGHKICIGPFLDADCQMLTSNSNDIRSEIRFKTLTNVTKCPSTDERCPIELKMFNALYPSCSQYKRCANGATAEECSNAGNMKIAINSVTGRTLNYNWSDGICISRGIERADFSQTGNVVKYGNFRNVSKGNDYIVSFSQSNYPIGMRNNGSFETGSENLVIAGSEYFSTDSNSTKLKYLKETIKNSSTMDLLQKYIGSTCDNQCISANINVRQKNIDEMGLCIKFDRINKIDFGGLDSNYKYRSGDQYLHYIPKRCDFYEAYVLGPGGKGEQWNANARLEFKTSSITECIGQVFKVAICYALGWLIGCDGDDEADYLKKVCTRSLNSQGGGGGGYAQGIIDLTKVDTDHLIIIPGKDMSFDLPLYTTWANRSSFNDYSDIDDQSSESTMRQKYQHSRISRFNSGRLPSNLFVAKRGKQGMPLATFAEGGIASYSGSSIVGSGYGLQACPTLPNGSSSPTEPNPSNGIDPEKYPNLHTAMTNNANGTNECYRDGEMSTACLYTSSNPSCILNSYCESDKVLFLKQAKPNFYSIDTAKYPYLAQAMTDNRNGRNPSCYNMSDNSTYCKYNNIKSSCVLNSTCESERASYGITDEYDARIKIHQSQQCYQWAKAKDKDDMPDTIACQTYHSTQSKSPGCNDDTSYNERKVNVNCVTDKDGKVTCDQITVYDWCCSTKTCTDQAEIKNKQLEEQTADMEEYESAQEEYAKEMEKYSNDIKSAEEQWQKILITSINNVCPFTVKGQNGGYDWPDIYGTVRENGGGNIAMLGINAIEQYSCTTDACLVEKADSIEYKMTYKYCYSKDTCTLEGGKSCSGLKTIFELFTENVDPDYKKHRQPHSSMGYYNKYGVEYSDYANGDSGKSNYGNNPFIGSGGCIVDSSTDNPLFNGVDTDDWDYTGDTQGNREAWGGNGWIRLGVPYVKYNTLGTVAMISGGKKILNKSIGVRDSACVPKCPRAFVSINNYVCEYSNGDPARLFESPVDSVINPIKCFDKNGMLHIPTSGVNRTCLFTSCKEMQNTGRYSDLCAGVDIYTGRYFAWGAAFFEEAVTTDEYSKYCGSSSLVLGVDYYSSDEFNKQSFSLTCDDHGNWLDKDNNKVTYSCPYINQKYQGFISQNISPLPNSTSSYGSSSGGKTCNPFGIWVNVT